MLKPHEYVCGFLFSEDRKSVALIKKKTPSWQEGKLNGIGGKSKPKEETVFMAMTREFFEETGVTVPEWRHFAVLTDTRTGSVIHFFEAASEAVHAVRTTTAEKVAVFEVARIRFEKCVRSVAWLIPLALDESKSIAHVFTTRNPYQLEK